MSLAPPDSVAPKPSDPQSLNRYSYVRNTPIARVDPKGHRDIPRSDYTDDQTAKRNILVIRMPTPSHRLVAVIITPAPAASGVTRSLTQVQLEKGTRFGKFGFEGEAAPTGAVLLRETAPSSVLVFVDA